MTDRGPDRSPSAPRAESPQGDAAGGTDPRQVDPKRTLARFGLLLTLARGAVAWEIIWPAVWPLLGVLGIFLALALSGILPGLPGWLHSVLLATFALAALGALGHALRRIALPDEQAGKRRLERDSGLDHRPLTALEDRMAAGTADVEARALWRAHQRRVIARLGQLRVGLPRPGMAAFDPWALRGLVVLLVLVGFAASEGNVGTRLAGAVTPSFTRETRLPPSLDAWINPPAYTGLAPIYLEAQIGAGETEAEAQAAGPPREALRVPAGSVLLAQVQGGSGAPSLQIAGAAEPFENFAHEAYRLEHALTEGDQLAIEQDGRTLAAWPLELVPDNAPEVAFQAPPARTERSALRITYQASDDYGLADVTAVVRRLDQPEAPPMELDLVLAGASPKTSEATTYHDLTPHPWAGLPVEIELVAKDQPGQEGRSEKLRTVIPERIFNHPIARALVELRKELTINPDRRLPVVQALSGISEHPEHFYHDIVVALTLRSAERRLIYDGASEAIAEVQELLWNAALRIEDGELAIAERRLREAQEALMEALERDASDEEIERLIDELQQALNDFLDEMIEQMRDQLAEQDGQEMMNQEMPPNSQLLNRQDLQEMLERARELARSGAKDAARDLLSQLRDMLENLRANPYAQQMNQDMQEASKMMRDLERMMREQQELLDRSFERSQQNQQGQQGEQGQPRQGGQNQADAQRQEQLRRQLGELMRQLGDALGEIPRPLGRAEREMRDARDALGNDQPGQAVPSQTRSLDQLQQGMQSALDQFMEMFAPGEGQGEGQVGARPNGNQRDPLGRESQGPGQGQVNREGVQIPDQMELRRTREIVDELRRRRGERSRPTIELDYLDRLLDQF
ncbi:TIGR02302 family protein [Pelagibius marinus]|uniref:TIGR02302 family protein n=1 Tax=Pelagibius marinus TaxID=2762760 RepID=UPI001872EF7B|nr:TIGR02302 family protein [Pelagibius marinus]